MVIKKDPSEHNCSRNLRMCFTAAGDIKYWEIKVAKVIILIQIWPSICIII
jgi:hypothetical protein